MITKIRSVTLLILFISFLAGACLDDFNRENDPIFYTPSYSLPIGPLEYTLEEIMPPLSLDMPIVDTSLIPDTIPLLIYDDTLFFVNPQGGHDTVFTGIMDIASIGPNMVYIQSAMFRVNYANGLPSFLSIQLYFFDGIQLVDSLFEEGGLRIENASLDQDGIVTGPYVGREEIYIDSSRINNILQVNNYELSIHVETYRENIDILRVYSYYEFDVQLALRAELLIPFE
ncbi:hypothetical protein ES705_11058 [subsurface metagenome]